MRVRPPPFDIEQAATGSPHDEDADLSRRLVRLIGSIEGGATAIFDGAWGVGKSTFVRRWMADLKRENIATVYLDAFASDYLESPFVAIAGSITEAIQNARKEKDPKYKQFISAASRVGAALATTSAKIGVRAITLGAVSKSDIDELTSIGDVIADDSAKWVADAIKDHNKRKGEVGSLRKSISEIADIISPDVSYSTSLVIIIDELDRCRPDFAIGLLENIKHFFGVDRVVFFLVCNGKQLEASLQHRYGQNVDAKNYLRKFYDFRIDYVLNYDPNHSEKLSKIISNLTNTFLIGAPDKPQIIEYITAIARSYRLSIRDIENIYTNIALSYVISDNLYKPAILVSFLCAIKVLEPELFRKAKSGDVTYKDIEKFINTAAWGNFNSERLLKIFQWHLDPDLDEQSEGWQGFSTFSYNLNRLNTIKFLSNTIVDRFDAPPLTTEGEDVSNGLG